MTNVTKYYYWDEEKKRGRRGEREEKYVLMGECTFDERGGHDLLVLVALWPVASGVLCLMVPQSEMEAM